MRRGGFETRPAFQNTAGNAISSDEINEGGFVINQLPPGRGYLLTFTRDGYTDRTLTIPNTTTGINTVPDVIY